LFFVGTVTYHAGSVVCLQKKAKDYGAQENVKVESYLSSVEESLPKKKKHKSTKSN
jgi:hypothetical protein